MKNFLPLTVLAAIALPAASHATEIMPDFASTLPPTSTSWVTDRYEPTSFTNVGNYQGRNDVLGIAITAAGNLANRPGANQSSFYNTQGRQHAAVGGAGSTVSADLFVDALWSDPVANGSVRSDVWGVVAGTNGLNYPILGFTNFGGAARFRYWDAESANGWVDLATAVNFGAWNSLSIGFTGSAFTFSVNGVLVATDGTPNGSTGFTDVIMQAYNFADPAIQGANPQDYVAHWSNTVAQGVPDAGATIGLLAVALVGMVGLRRKIAG